MNVRGEVVVVTGTFSRPRGELEAQLVALGATLGSSVTKKTESVRLAVPRRVAPRRARPAAHDAAPGDRGGARRPAMAHALVAWLGAPAALLVPPPAPKKGKAK